MDDIKSRLEKIAQLKKNINKISQSQKNPSIHIVNQEKKIEEVVSGKFISTPFGDSFVRENYFPQDYRCGEVELFQIFQFSAKTISSLARDDRLKEIDINKTVFLDTETTGLAGGAGTYIFLVGAGYFEGDQFCVRQYFMRDYNEERALLSAVNKLLSKYEVIVSYNGKTFDVPLIQSRFIMSGMKLNLENPGHFDLLYPARRLWKRRLENCSLSTVERDILGVIRENDVPGYLVPEIYFRYLKTKDARALKQVFEHNLQDILSLVALVSRMCFLVEDPLNNTEYGMDIFSIGKMFDEEKRYEQSTHYYTEALKHNLAEEEVLEILRLASFAYKRQGEWEEAEKIWKKIIERSREFIYYPYEESAKYYEHHLKDYQKAETIIEEALNIVENIFIREKLQYRLNRIKGKQRCQALLLSLYEKEQEMEKKNYTVKDWPDEERPRERLLKQGVEYLTDAELLGIILFNGYQGKTSVDIAKELLLESGGLRKLDSLSYPEMSSVKGIGLAKFAQIKAALEIGKRFLRETNSPKKKIHNALDLVNYYGPCMRDLKKEKFKVIMLDVKNKIIKDIDISVGSLTESIVHPREVLKEIIKESAASVIFLHNHPSGESNPSKNDMDITERLAGACELVGVKVLDHIILGEDNYFSFAQEGLLKKVEADLVSTLKGVSNT